MDVDEGRVVEVGDGLGVGGAVQVAEVDAVVVGVEEQVLLPVDGHGFRAGHVARAAAPKAKFAYDFGACAAHRCVDSVNGGFLYSRARGGAVDAALEAWFADCGAIWERRANQPSLVAALRGAACAYDAGGAGSAAPDAWRPANATSFLGARRPKLVVANQDLFVSGRRQGLLFEDEPQRWVYFSRSRREEATSPQF